MKDHQMFWDIALRSAKRSVELEGVENISFACLKRTGSKDFEIEYGFHNAPTEGDLEALSLIETEIIADIWNWVSNFHYTWSICSHTPKINENKNSVVFYRSAA